MKAISLLSCEMALYLRHAVMFILNEKIYMFLSLKNETLLTFPGLKFQKVQFIYFKHFKHYTNPVN